MEQLFEKFKREIINLLTPSSCLALASCACSGLTVESQAASPKPTLYQGLKSENGDVLSSWAAPLDGCAYVEPKKAMETSTATHMLMWDKESVCGKHYTNDPNGKMLMCNKTAQIKCSQVRQPVLQCHSAVKSSYSLTIQSLPVICTENQSGCSVTVQPCLPLESTKSGAVNGNVPCQDYDIKDTAVESSDNWYNICMLDGDMLKGINIPTGCNSCFIDGAAVSPVAHSDHQWSGESLLSFTSALNSAGDEEDAMNGADVTELRSCIVEEDCIGPKWGVHHNNLNGNCRKSGKDTCIVSTGSA